MIFMLNVMVFQAHSSSFEDGHVLKDGRCFDEYGILRNKKMVDGKGHKTSGDHVSKYDEICI